MTKEERSTYNKVYYESHKGKIVAERKVYEATVGGKIAKLWKHTNQHHPGHTISREWIERKVRAGVCELTGIAFRFSNIDRDPLAPSVDVIDNSLPVTEDNAEVILCGLNYAKNVNSNAILKEFVLALCGARDNNPFFFSTIAPEVEQEARAA